MNVENYCVSYHCDEDVGDEGAWLVHLKSCLCMKNDSEIFQQLGENFEITLINKYPYNLPCACSIKVKLFSDLVLSSNIGGTLLEFIYTLFVLKKNDA